VCILVPVTVLIQRWEESRGGEGKIGVTERVTVGEQRVYRHLKLVPNLVVHDAEFLMLQSFIRLSTQFDI
jgi:hypothetical protein